MTYPTHGTSTPGDDTPNDQVGPASYGPSDPAAHGRGGIPAPPRPVFQRPPGYDTLSPASPYTVVFEPWPDTTGTQASAQEAGTANRPADPATTPVPEPAPPVEAGTDVASERLSPQPAQMQPSGTDSQTDEPSASPTAQTADPQPYAPATQPYAPATQPYAPATQPYGPDVQPALAPSFAPSATQPYGGPAAVQPYPGSSNPQPDPYFSLLRPPTAPPQFGSARPRRENVGRGLAMALIAVVGGCVLSAFVYHLGFVASIVALAMGAAGIFLYAKGAGAPPRKGALALVVLLIAGILLAWVSSVGTELYFYYVDRTGTAAGAVLFVLESVLSVDLFKAMLKDFLIFVGFGVLGIFGVARQLFTRRAR